MLKSGGIFKMKCKPCGAKLESSICEYCKTDSGMIILSQKEYKEFCNDEQNREIADRDCLTVFHKIEPIPYDLFLDDHLRYVGLSNDGKKMWVNADPELIKGFKETEKKLRTKFETDEWKEISRNI